MKKKKKNRPKFPNGYKKKKKVKAVKIKKPTNKQQLIEILQTAKGRLNDRLKFNSVVKFSVNGREYNYSQLSNDSWVAGDIKTIDKYIKQLQQSNIRPRKKTVELYRQLYKIENKISTLGAYTNTREANFNHLILKKLEESGIDPTNPSAIATLFNGRTIDEVYEAWTFKGEDKDNFYEEISADPQEFIKDIVNNYDDIIEDQRIKNDKVFNDLLEEMMSDVPQI